MLPYAVVLFRCKLDALMFLSLQLLVWSVSVLLDSVLCRQTLIINASDVKLNLRNVCFMCYRFVSDNELQNSSG